MLIRAAVAADARAIAGVQVASWRSTYRGIVDDDYIDGLTAEAREQAWADFLARADAECVVFVAEGNDTGVVGFASGGPVRDGGEREFGGELYAIYLLAEHQRRGLGGRLVRAVAAALGERGHRSMLVWVLERNPACAFYEAMGGRRIKAEPLAIGGATYASVAYGWDDIGALLAPDAGC